MGLFRLVYKIGRMVFRDFLFKIPKKYLVTIIVFLVLLLLKSNVFAVSYSQDNFDFNIPDNVLEIYYNSPFYNEDYYSVIWQEDYKNLNPVYKAYFVPKTNTNFYFSFKDGSSSDQAIDDNYYTNRIIYCNYAPSNAYIYNNLENNPTTYVSYSGVLNRYYNRLSNGSIRVWGTNDSLKINDIYITFPPAFTPPIITNDTTDITNWNFDYLLINGGSLVPSNTYGQNYYWLEQSYNGTTNNIDIDNYYTTLNGVMYFTIPRNLLLSDSAVIIGKNVTFSILQQESVEGGRQYNTYELGTYTFGMTQIEQDNINEDKTQQALDNIANAQQQTTNAINVTNNFLQDTSVNDNNISINTPNIANSDSVITIDNNITSIFNSFINILSNSSGHYEINIPLPNFTNGGQYSFVTFNSVITQNVLNGTNIPGFNFNCYTLVQLFWWFVLGGYLIRLLYRIATFIYEGKIFTPSSIVSDIANEYGKITGAFI